MFVAACVAAVAAYSECTRFGHVAAECENSHSSARLAHLRARKRRNTAAAGARREPEVSTHFNAGRAGRRLSYRSRACVDFVPCGAPAEACVLPLAARFAPFSQAAAAGARTTNPTVPSPVRLATRTWPRPRNSFQTFSLLSAMRCCLTLRSSGPSPAGHLGREAVEAYHPPRGQGALPPWSAQLKR